MKKSYITMLLGSVLALTTSCQKDVSLEPIFFRPTTFTSEAQLSGQLAGVYNVLSQDQLYGQGLWGYLVAGADESFRNGVTNGTILTELYNIGSNEANIGNFWRNLYIGAERASVLLDVVDIPKMDETARNNIKGQAMFLRAFYYYLLVTHFGDVPLKTQLTTDMGTNFNLPRTPAKDVYQFIIDEMTKAQPLVQTIQQTGTPTIVTRSAVQAMLVRVCMSMAGNPVNDGAKYRLAQEWAQKLITSNAHSLNATPLPQAPNTPAYARLFINNMQNNVNDPNITEGIWDAAFLSKSNQTGAFAATGFPVTQQLGALMGVTSPNASANAPVGFSSGTYRVHNRLFRLFAPGDQRRDWAIAPFIYRDNTTNRFDILRVNLTGGGGTGATALALTSPTGAISSIVIENPGQGYTSAPTVSFSAIAGTGAAATAVVEGGRVTAVNVTAAGSAYPTAYDRPVGKWRREYELNVPQVRLQNNTSCNFPIIRYADVLLMAAEADLRINGTPSAQAVEYYNQVRRRAFGQNPRTPSPTVDVATFSVQDIMDERSRELCFEGVRRADLLRWGMLQQAMQRIQADVAANAPSTFQTAASVAANNLVQNFPRHALLPIPATEIDRAPAITQNPGW
ncbi:RagB/SusD family nutrient uptake outer membrane protein [Rudanella paleaurantiibacter]|uniref:RagB/SusD family nutrient uptake outer membrane protein n=1 Tax=Rudanella paleaurantiibacter TaxID=2614655 RepID=A0A7J5TTL6_9BACT|nr:RagB/SusD family nutrient uptake outer membrane protein [Rudanella paleaurantiibacter]KAB7727260.1 RagB/SusD family nutrient uptake outer membrane protein [Rudanella paleaurantiibacter]